MTRSLPTVAAGFALPLTTGALILLAVGCLLAFAAPGVSAQAAEPAFGALVAGAACPTGVDPDRDFDGDCVDDDLEESGYDADLRPCTPGAEGCFVTDPRAWSTDGDPFSDFQEVTKTNMDRTIGDVYQHPLVAAVPKIEVYLTGYTYKSNAEITDTEGGSIGTGFEATYSVESTTSATTTVGTEVGPTGPSGSAEQSVSQSVSVGFSATASVNAEVNWETATSTKQSEAASLVLFLGARNTGNATAKNITPKLNVYIGGELVATITPGEPLPRDLAPGDELATPIAVDRRTDGSRLEEINITFDQLRRLRRGAPVRVRVVGLDAEVERWRPEDSNWACGDSTNPCLWESFERQITARTLRIGLDFGYSGDPDAVIPERYEDNPYEYFVYTGTDDESVTYTLRDVARILGWAEGSGAAFQINGRSFPSAWVGVSGPVGQLGTSFATHWQRYKDDNPSAEWPGDLLEMPLPRNSHLALLSPDPVDPFPVAGGNLVTGTMRRVLVAVGTKGGIPVAEAEAHLFQHGVETVVPMERLPGSDVWATPDSLSLPVSVGSSYVVLRDRLGEESRVGPGLTPVFPAAAGASASPCAEIARAAYRAPDFGSDAVGVVTVFVGGDPDQPATAFCDADGGTDYWAPQSVDLGTLDIRGVAVLDVDRRVAVGEGVLLRSEDGGQSWVEVPLPDDVPANTLFWAVSFREDGAPGAEVGIAVSNNGVFVRTDDGGRSWTRVPSATEGVMGDVDYAGGDTWFAVGENRIRRSDDDGLTWRAQGLQAVDADGNPVSRPGFRTFTAVEFIDEGVGVVGDAAMSDDRGRIYATTDGGDTWRETAVITRHHDIAYNGLDGWAIVQWSTVSPGRILHVPNLLDPVDAESNPLTFAFRNPTGAPLQRLWAVDFATPEIGFAVAQGGEVYRTENGGLAWERASGYPTGAQPGTQLMLDIDMLDANVGAVVGTGGAVGGTDSGGGVPTYSTVGGVAEEDAPVADLPPGVALEAAAPNPLRQSARLRYALDAPGRARLTVYDALGREVAVVVDGDRGAGTHEAQFDASALASGVYIVRLVAGGAVATRTVTVVR